MSITLLGITLGGEAAKRKDASNLYAIKYPISGDVNALRQNLGRAVIELGDLKGQTPESAADKRTQQRNITALTTQTINLQNAINDASLNMGSSSNNYTIKKPNFSIKSPYATDGSITTTKTGPISRPTKQPKNVPGLDKKPQEEVVDNTDGGQPQVGTQTQIQTQPQGAKGDYPPPKGDKKTNYGKWIGLGVLVAGLGTIGYVFLKKKK
jgi:hypothetical protein